jgi:CrcB protein
MRVLLIVLGAAIGAPARFAIDQYIQRHSFRPARPYGIFAVNILGSFILGLTLNSSEKVYDLFAIGFAGAFTTWSTFILDIFLAAEVKRRTEAIINLIASLSIGLFAAWLGLHFSLFN